MLRAKRLLAGTLLLTTTGAPAQAPAPQQTAIGGVNNIGDFNNLTNINNFYLNALQQLDTKQLAALVARSIEEKADKKGDTEIKRLRSELEEAKRTSQEDQDTLRKLIAELLARDRELQELTQTNLQLRLKLQEQIAKLPEGQAKEETKSALDDADFQRVQAILDLESADIQDPQHPGVIVAMVSDQRGGIGGIAGGFYFDGAHMPGVGGKEVGFLPFTGSAEVLVGSARLEGRSSFHFSLSSLAGPKLRLGAPHSLVLGAYYYFPAIMLMHGRVRFPLVGIGASLGYQSDQIHLSVVYRYSMTSLLYSSEPNVHFLGLAMSFPTITAPMR